MNSSSELYASYFCFFVSEKPRIDNKKMNEENKTIDNLIENTDKKSTESIQSGNLGYYIFGIICLTIHL